MTKSTKTNEGFDNTDQPAYSNSDASEHTLITKHNVWRVKCVQIPVKKTKPKPTENKIAAPLQSAYILTGRQRHTQEQVEALIGYLVRDKMAMWKVAKKVKISVNLCKRYYQQYINDNKIPAPNSVNKQQRNACSQHQVNKLINYIVHDKMEIKEAAERADLGIRTAKHHYGQYLNGSPPKIPRGAKFYTQKQVNQLFHHYKTDSDSVGDAARKVNMPCRAAFKYITRYKADPMHKIPLAGEKSRLVRTKYTYSQIEQMIRGVTDKGMSVHKAAIKFNMCPATALRYWKKYLNDPYHRIPLPAYSTQCIKFTDYPTAERVKEFIDCVFKSNMSLKEASDITKIPGPLAMRYYHFYIKDPEHKVPVPSLPAKHLK